MKSSGLSAAEVAGHKEVAIHYRVVRWKYEFNKSRLHAYYMLTSSNGVSMMGVRVKDEVYFHGKNAICLHFEELYQLYHQDALDISFVST
jgi:hypothetical protein